MDYNSNEEGNGDGDEGGGQVTAIATAMKRMMAMATTVAGDKEGNDNGGKSNGDGDEGGGQAN